jgi:hypothetical protein
MKVINNFTYNISIVITAVALAVLASAITISPPNALADTSWMKPGQVYDSWNAAQYDLCANDGSVSTIIVDDTAVDPLQTNQFGVPSAIIPANCFSQNTVITNNASVPVTLTYAGGFDNGTIADYIFEWIDGWSDVTLDPGDSTPQFTFSVGMPWDVPNAGRDLAGKFWYEWELKKSGSTLTPPVAVSDGSADPNAPGTIATPYQTAVEIDVMANDTVYGAILTNVTGGNGAWSIVGDQVRFVPAAGFSGVAQATYTITNADGSSSAEIFVMVLADTSGVIGVPGTGVGQVEDGSSVIFMVVGTGLAIGILVGVHMLAKRSNAAK